MAFGINKNLPLLTIAIPTWNRAKTLDEALGFLLPQVNSFKQDIEVIVSDNASEDQTKEVIEKYILNFPTLNIIFNRNCENIKFFGNFNRCKELAKGKFIWILSDDDFICENVIGEVMNHIHKGEDEYALIFLKNNNSHDSFHTQILNKIEFMRSETYNMGLISSAIFLNLKNNDESIISTYPGSGFIGFISVLNSFNFKNKVLTISGRCLNQANAIPTGYNFFDIFINHMGHVINYMQYVNFSNRDIKHFKNSYLIDFIRPRYLFYKAENKLNFGHFEKTDLREVDVWIRKEYSDLWRFWFCFFPLMLIPSQILTITLGFYRYIKKSK